MLLMNTNLFLSDSFLHKQAIVQIWNDLYNFVNTYICKWSWWWSTYVLIHINIYIFFYVLYAKQCVSTLTCWFSFCIWPLCCNFHHMYDNQVIVSMPAILYTLNTLCCCLTYCTCLLSIEINNISNLFYFTYIMMYPSNYSNVLISVCTGLVDIVCSYSQWLYP